MFHLTNNQIPIAALDHEIHRLRRLLQDLESLRAGQTPNRKQLAHAPVINDWRIIGRPEPCLAGKVTGHPNIKNGHMAITTPLWLIAPMHGYARTLSRYYLIGRPASDDGSSH
ncbi:MAG: DUF6634 family protein [Xanthobacteraceae bacterium]